MEILANIEMPNGKKPYTVVVQVESDKDTLFRIPLLGSVDQRELQVETAIKLSDQAWNLAWNTINEKIQKALEKYQNRKLK